jgi:protein-S-isoprenylcysteine O-methyltransferase Ste14
VNSLAARTTLGFVQLFVCLAILLFVPAWTIHFWQAWVYLFIFASASASITVYLWNRDRELLERRVSAGPGAEKEKSQKLIQALASLAFFAEMILPSLDHRFSWSRVPFLTVIAGDVLVMVGFFIVLLVFKENSFAAATIGVASGQKVIATGPYAIVRHPMYAGALVLLIGTPLALGSWWGILAVIPMTLVLALRLLDEEKFLSKSLPGYEEYCQKVRSRLAPSIW